MKTTLSIFAGILLCAASALAQGGSIGLYVDEDYLERCFDDTGPQLIPVFVVHTAFTGVFASQFMLVNGGGFSCVYVGETPAFPTVIGGAYNGISISYGQCMFDQVLLLTVRYFCYGASPECSFVEVVPDPAAPTGTIEIVDCEMTKRLGWGLKMWVNPYGYCRWECYRPTRNITWGQIKAQY